MLMLLDLKLLLLAYACLSGFKLLQMDVKITFLIGFINEEVYVTLPQVLKTISYLDKSTSSRKLFYGLKRALR